MKEGSGGVVTEMRLTPRKRHQSKAVATENRHFADGVSEGPALFRLTSQRAVNT